MPCRSQPLHVQKLTIYEFRQPSQVSKESPMSPRPAVNAMLAFGALLVLAGCDAKTAPMATAPGAGTRPVQVQRVAFTSSAPARAFVGIVRARYETDLGFRVAGKITARLVNVGDRVRTGDVVARLDPQDLKLQVESAQAELAAATSSLEQASIDYDRYVQLRARGFAATADLDRRKTARDEADGRLQRAKRALDLATNQLDYTDLKADADGVITSTMAEAGQVVAVGQAVARLAHRGEKEAVVALPETWLAQARSAEPTVRLWSDPDHAFQARLRELAPAGDPDLCGAVHNHRCRRRRRARHDRDRDAGACRRHPGRETAARGHPQPRQRAVRIRGRRVQGTDAASGRGCFVQ